MEIFNHDSNIPFLGMRKFSIAIALFLVVASIGLIATRGLNYALDFTGGVSMVVDYDQSVEISDVRTALAKGGFDHAIVQSLGGTREVSIRMQPKDDQKAVDAVRQYRFRPAIYRGHPVAVQMIVDVAFHLH